MTTDHLPSGTGFLPTDLVRSVDGTEMYRIIEADDTPVVVAVLRVENVTVSRSLTGAMFDDAVRMLKSRLIGEGSTAVSTRVGEHETVVAVRVAAPVSASDLEEFVLAQLRRPLEVRGQIVPVELRVGISRPDPRCGSAMERISRARRALALASAGHPVRIHDRSVEAQLHLRHLVSDDLPRLLRDNLSAIYQPVLDLRDNEIVAAEALMRIDHPALGRLTPAVVLPMLGETLQLELTRRMIGHAMAAATEWSARAAAPRHVSVNLPPEQLAKEELLWMIDDAAAATGGDPDMLVLEVLETVIASPTPDSAVRNGLRRRGVRLAVDDFGTGYSTLEQMARLDADMLKVDRHLTAQLGLDEPDGTAAAMAVHIGRSRGLPVVAEGVERPEQLEGLRWLRCRYAQGWFIARPESLEALLQR